MKTIVICLLTAAVLLGQPAKKRLTFEIVSIKPHTASDDPTMMPFGVVGGRYTASNVRVRQLIVAAYVDSGMPLQPSVEVAGLSGWAATEGFDIQAQTEAGFTPTKQQTMEMLQALLEDRFQLKIQRVPKSAPVYALVVDTDGLKLKENPTPTGPPAGARPGPGRVLAPSIAMLIPVLTSAAGRKIVDKTGLTGLYRIDLSYAPDPPPPGVEIDPNLPSLFTALREQLGLRLVPETALVDTFVVESVERPSEN